MAQFSKCTEAEELEAVLIATVIESWRFAGVFERALLMDDPVGARRYASKLGFFRERIRTHLADAGLHIVEPERGTSWDPGMAITPLNIGDFDEDDPLKIDQVLEPTVMDHDGVRRVGTVMLRKAD